MKLSRKLFAVLLSAILVLTMAVPAFAEGEDEENATTSNYTITVTNAEAGATYSAYKIFDATSSGSAVSYTIPSDSEIASATGFGNIFDTTKTGDLTYVTVKKDVAETQVTTWLKAYVASQTGATAAATGTNSNNADTVVLDVNAQGYYYVTTATGSAVTITTVTGSATVIDKNERTPSINPNDGKKVATSENGEYTTVTTMNVGDTAYFQITFTAVNYEVDKDGNSTQITEYTVTDTPNGFSINESSVAVKVGGSILTNTTDVTLYDVSVDETTGALTVKIDWDDAAGKTVYDATETVEVTYTATLTNKNLAAASTNKAEIKYNNTTLTDTPEVKVYNYTVAIDKYATNANDADDKNTKLSGAKFVLYKVEGEEENAKNMYYVVGTDGAVTWTDDQSKATVVTTGTDGKANFQGLAAGSYYLLETEAPAGYNLLGTATLVTLDEISNVLTGTTSLTNTTSVGNSSGSTLPTTGGMGTTVLYILGSIMVIGAGILLVTRRRMSIK